MITKKWYLRAVSAIVVFMLLFGQASYALAHSGNNYSNNENEIDTPFSPKSLPDIESGSFIELSGAQLVSGNNSAVVLTFTLPVSVNGETGEFIYIIDKSTNCQIHAISCTAIDPVRYNDVVYANSYYVLFEKELPQEGQICVVDKSNNLSCVPFLPLLEENAFEAPASDEDLFVDYSIPLQAVGMAIIAPNQAVLFYNYDIGNYNERAIAITGDAHVDAISVEKIDDRRVLLTFADNLPISGELRITGEAGNEEKVPFQNPWLYIKKTEIVDSHTIRIYLSEKSKFVAEYPETNIFALIGDIGIAASDIIPIDGDQIGGASIFDIVFEDELAGNGFICLMDEAQSAVNDLASVAQTIDGKPLFANYGLTDAEGKTRPALLAGFFAENLLLTDEGTTAQESAAASKSKSRSGSRAGVDSDAEENNISEDSTKGKTSDSGTQNDGTIPGNSGTPDTSENTDTQAGTEGTTDQDGSGSQDESDGTVEPDGDSDNTGEPGGLDETDGDMSGGEDATGDEGTADDEDEPDNNPVGPDNANGQNDTDVSGEDDDNLDGHSLGGMNDASVSLRLGSFASVNAEPEDVPSEENSTFIETDIDGFSDDSGDAANNSENVNVPEDDGISDSAEMEEPDDAAQDHGTPDEVVPDNSGVPGGSDNEGVSDASGETDATDPGEEPVNSGDIPPETSTEDPDTSILPDDKNLSGEVPSDAVVVSVPGNVSIRSTTETSLSWDAIEGATSYDIERDGVIIGSVSDSYFQTNGLVPEQLQSFRIRANIDGMSGDWTTLYIVTSVSNISGGTITNNTVWSSAVTTYSLSGNLIISSGVSLSIMPGITVKIASGKSISVNGTLNAVGTAEDPIVFTSTSDAAYGGSGAAVYWNGFDVGTTGEFNADHTKIRYAGRSGSGNDYAIDVTGAGKLDITNSEITDSYYGGINILNSTGAVTIDNNIITTPNYGILISNAGAGNIQITNNRISSSGSSAVMISSYQGGTLAIQDNVVGGSAYSVQITTSSFKPATLTGFEYNTFSKPVLLSSGTLLTDLTLGEYITCVNGSVTIAQGKTLTLLPGAIIYGTSPSSLFVINGKINAVGTAGKPIIFTSTGDAAYGGSGSVVYWNGFDIGTTGELNADHAKIRYAGRSSSGNDYAIDVTGAGKLNLTNSEITDSYYGGINILNSTGAVTIDNNTISTPNYGIRISNTGTGNIQITNNQISSSGSSAIMISAYPKGDLTIRGNTVSGGTYSVQITTSNFTPTMLTGFEYNTFSKPVYLLSGTLSIDLTLGEYITYVSSTVTIALGKTLTFLPGAIVHGASQSGLFVINGKINAIGTAEKPIVFTSTSDTEYGGSGTAVYWTGFDIGSAGEFNASYIKIRYAGQGTNATTGNACAEYAIDVTGAGKLDITNSEITNSPYTCIRVSGTCTGSVRIENNLITCSGNSAIILSATGGMLVIQGNTVSGGTYSVQITTSSFAPATLTGFEYNTFNKPVLLSSGTLSTDLTLGEYITYVSSTVTIALGKTLTFLPGAIVHGASRYGLFVVNGRIDAIGTAEKPIIFTSTGDTAYGGNGLTVYWNGFDIGGTGEFNASYIKLRYAGQCANSEGNARADYAIDVTGAGKLNVTNSEITNIYSTGIRISSTGTGSVRIENNQITCNGNTAIILTATGGTLIIQGNTVSGSTYSVQITINSFAPTTLTGFEYNTFSKPVYLSSGTLSTDLTLGEYTTYLSGSVTVAPGKTLTLLPGAIIQGEAQYGLLVINGKVDAIGTAEKPIIFTSTGDAAYGGSGATVYWNGFDISATGE